MSDNVWTVPATVVRVVDGDTVVLDLDLGWHVTYRARCRLAAVNAPEMDTEEGREARLYASAELAKGVPSVVLAHDPGAAATAVGARVVFVSHQLDKYGRPLGQVLISDPQGGSVDLGAALLADGHAVPMAY